MSVTLDEAIAANHESAKRFVARARTVAADQWANPVAPGKWSPAQLLDHVAVSTEVALNAIKGDKAMGSIPRIFRPLARRFILKPTLVKGALPAKMKGPPIFAPSQQHLALEVSANRLDRAIGDLETHVRGLAAQGTELFEHGFFGWVVIADYVRFNALHLNHHEKQLPAPRQ